jgi:hypothetical protein
VTAATRATTVTDPDGATVEIFPLPTDDGSLEALLRDLFEQHWDKITFGPLIQGAAWEIRAPHAPTHIGMLDGYLTVAFDVSHFHLCIGPHKGPPNHPAPEALAITGGRERSFIGGSTNPAHRSRGAAPFQPPRRAAGDNSAPEPAPGA